MNLSKYYTRSFMCACACLIVLVITSACNKAEPPKKSNAPKKIKLLTVGPPTILDVREYPGTVKALNTADLSFSIAGKLIELPVKAGQVVKKGELLAKLDPRDFESARDGVKANLETAKVKLKTMQIGARPEDIKRLEASVRAREAKEEEVRLRYERHAKLFKEKVISRQEYDTIKAELDVAKEELVNAEQELVIGKKGARDEDIESQEQLIKGLAADLRQAEKAVDDTKQLAPFDGLIARKEVDNFEEVQAKKTILTIQDVSKIKIAINIPERSFAKIGESGVDPKQLVDELGILVKFTPIPDREFKVQLHSYQTEADPKTQTFEIVFVLDQPEDVKISPGMNATVYGSKNTIDDDTKYLIPLQAVFADAEKNQLVWVVDAETNQVSHRTIKVGEMTSGMVRVISGLKKGEQIAVSAVHSLRKGMKVEQMPKLGEL